MDNPGGVFRFRGHRAKLDRCMARAAAKEAEKQAAGQKAPAPEAEAPKKGRGRPYELLAGSGKV